jgi:tetratricopeptide (TPR) repeat protein
MMMRLLLVGLLSTLTACAATAPRQRAGADAVLRHAATQNYTDPPNADRVRRELAQHLETLGLLDVEQPGKAGLADLREATQVLWRMGAAYSQLGQHSQSLRVYEQILQVLPDADFVQYDRAVELFALGEHATAAEAYARALRGDPDNAFGVRSAGFFALARRDYAVAEERFARAMRLSTQPDDRAYAALGVVLAAQAQGKAADAALRALNGQSTTTRWPGPLLAFLLGRASGAAVVRALQDAPADQQGNLCEALYYIGYALESRGDRAGAAAHYHAVKATQVSGFFEYSGAAEGLRRLALP